MEVIEGVGVAGGTQPPGWSRASCARAGPHPLKTRAPLGGHFGPDAVGRVRR